MSMMMNSATMLNGGSHTANVIDTKDNPNSQVNGQGINYTELLETVFGGDPGVVIALNLDSSNISNDSTVNKPHEKIKLTPASNIDLKETMEKFSNLINDLSTTSLFAKFLSSTKKLVLKMEDLQQKYPTIFKEIINESWFSKLSQDIASPKDYIQFASVLLSTYSNGVSRHPAIVTLDNQANSTHNTIKLQQIESFKYFVSVNTLAFLQELNYVPLKHEVQKAIEIASRKFKKRSQEGDFEAKGSSAELFANLSINKWSNKTVVLLLSIVTVVILLLMHFYR